MFSLTTLLKTNMNKNYGHQIPWKQILKPALTLAMNKVKIPNEIKTPVFKKQDISTLSVLKVKPNLPSIQKLVKIKKQMQLSKIKIPLKRKIPASSFSMLTLKPTLASADRLAELEKQLFLREQSYKGTLRVIGNRFTVTTHNPKILK